MTSGDSGLCRPTYTNRTVGRQLPGFVPRCGASASGELPQAPGQRDRDPSLDPGALGVVLLVLDTPGGVQTSHEVAAMVGNHHVHGGVGIDTDHPVHRYFLAAKQTEFALGGATGQLLKIGRELADTPA